MWFKVINMDIFLQKYIALLQKAFIMVSEVLWITFMMEGCTFLGFKISSATKAWKSQILFKITLIVFG